jgi:hypothetical protein
MGAGGRRQERKFDVAPVVRREALAAKNRVIQGLSVWREPERSLPKPTEDDDAAWRRKRHAGGEHRQKYAGEGKRPELSNR